MGITAVYNPYGDTDHTIPTHAQKRVKFIWGSLSYGATAGGGATWTMPGVSNIMGCIIEPANGYVYRYDIDNSLVKAYYNGAHASITTAAAFAQVATGVSTATCTGISFFAWGYE